MSTFYMHAYALLCCALLMRVTFAKRRPQRPTTARGYRPRTPQRGVQTMGHAAACAGRCLHGVCINGTCVCERGWSGNADLLTGDLTPWGGPLLDCTTNLHTLMAMWWIVFGLCSVALLVVPVTIYQQRQKLLILRTQGFQKHWFQYPPLFFVVGHAIIVLLIFSMAVVKVSTPDFRKVFGIDPFLSVCYLANFAFGAPLSYSFLLDVLGTFSGGIRNEMAPNQWRQKLLDVSRFFFVLSAFFCASFGMYLIACLSVSPLSGRHIHALCNRLMSAQMALASFLTAIACIAFTVEIIRNINCTVRERVVFAKWTRSAQMRDSLISLRRTRFKVVALQLTAITVSSFFCGANLWMAIDSSLQLYSSYKIACMTVGYMQFVLLVLLSYTSVNVPLRLFLAFSASSVSFRPSAETSVAIPQTNNAATGSASFKTREQCTLNNSALQTFEAVPGCVIPGARQRI